MKPTHIMGAAMALMLLGSCRPAEYADARSRIDLSGEWQTDLGMAILPGTTDENGLGDGLPDSTGTGRLARLKPFEGIVRYRRTVSIPDSLRGQHLELIMEKTKPSTLWIDGDSIGHIGHLHAPHVYDVSRSLTPGEHTVCIDIDNRPQAVPQGIHGSHAWTDHTQTNWNGILGRFCIEASAPTRISRLRARGVAERRSVSLGIDLTADRSRTARLKVEAHSWNTPDDSRHDAAPWDTTLTLAAGTSHIDIEYPLGADARLWSEFDPTLYRVCVSLGTDSTADSRILDIGLRTMRARGTQFSINGLTTFLRGKHDACVFPLTGYAPMDVEAWRKVYRTAKDYGINHYRFHSWTPPEAAFEAADIEGIYLQPETPYWGTLGTDTVLNDFLLREGLTIIDAFGHHASFTMMALGNELNGDLAVMQQMVAELRRADPDRLYSFGSNNNLGTAGQVEGEDYFVTCRVGADTDSTYSTHVRSSFSFADAYKGGILNNTYPGTRRNYAGAIGRCTVPVVSHESCQFQIYPDYDEMALYTGVLYPFNLGIFRDRLRQAGMADQADAFHLASGALSMDCYKADIEMCLRTPGFGGFQMLDLQDYPGQGTALVGVLDAFMQSKGIITPDEFRQFCNRVVPMAEFDSYCIGTDRPFEADVVVANYSESARSQPLTWSITSPDSLTVFASGTLQADVAQGTVGRMGSISADISTDKARRLSLNLTTGRYCNHYDLWAYPPVTPQLPASVSLATQLTPAVLDSLEAGATVLFVPRHADIGQCSVGGLFTPDYWNYAMFKGISEWLHREVSPGTLSVLVNPAHPIFAEFPTQMQSNWQWWPVARNSRPLVLDKAPAECRPIVQVVDNFERNHKLGILTEFAVGRGRIMLCTCDLDAIANKPEGRQFAQAIYAYMASEDFAPQCAISRAELCGLVSDKAESRNIVGEKNITDYE